MTLTADPTTTEEELAPAVEADAREFGTHINTGGWRLGLLTARSVTPGLGEGRPPKDREAETGSPVAVSANGKVSARTFAARSGTSHKRVGRYLAAWQRAADKGLVPDPIELDPGDEVELPDAKLWGDFYSTKRGEAGLRCSLSGRWASCSTSQRNWYRRWPTPMSPAPT